MNILDYTEDHQATHMRDVIPTLIGKWVCVYVGGSNNIQGFLREYNGSLLKLDTTNGSSSYIRSDAVLAITGED